MVPRPPELTMAAGWLNMPVLRGPHLMLADVAGEDGSRRRWPRAASSIMYSGWQERHPLRYEESSTAEIKPQYMIEALYEATGGDGILTSDVGQHQMWAAQYFHVQAPAPVDQLGRPGDDGLRPAGRDGREGRLPAIRSWRASPATARSR